MQAETFAVEVIHWFGTVCLVASLLVRVIPLPEEIPWRGYRVLYNVLRRCALNAGWQARSSGNGSLTK